MKKLTYLILGLIVLGGVIFAFSQTSLFKGNLNLPVTEDLASVELGDPVRTGEDTGKGEDSPFDIEDFRPGETNPESGSSEPSSSEPELIETDPEKTEEKPVSSDVETGTKPEEPTDEKTGVIPVKVTDKNGEKIEIGYKNVTFYNPSGTAVKVKESDVETKEDQYNVEVEDGDSRQVEIVVDGYVIERTSFIDPVEESDADEPYEISLKHSIKINVEDEKGNGIETEGSVTANKADCPRLIKDPSMKGYGCAVSEKVTSIDYSVEVDGYIPASGTFENDKDPGTQTVYTVTLERELETAVETLPEETELAASCVDLRLSMTETEKGANLVATGEASDGSWEGKLIFVSNGLGLFDENNISVSGLTFTSTVDYTHEGGSSTELSAYIVGEEEVCTSNTEVLVITPAETPAETPASTTTTTTTTPTTTTTTTTTTDTETENEPEEDTQTTTSTTSSSSLADCEDPFLDTGDIEEWPGKYVCPSYGKTVDGRTPTTFDPYAMITRSEWLKVILKTAGYTTDDAAGLTEDFLDVNATDWEYPYVKIAQDLDVIRVRDFGPYWNGDVPITRGDAVLYAVRLAELTNYDINLPFSDVPSTYYAAYAIDLAYDTFVDFADEGLVRVIQGYEDNTFKPYNHMSRAEAVTLALRMSLAWFEGIIDFNI